MEYESLIRKLKKLREMSLRGERHEAENAQRMLAKFLDANGLSLSDIVDDVTIQNHDFHYASDKSKMFVFDSCANNMGLEVYELSQGGRKINYSRVKCSNAQWAELLSRFEFYHANYVKEIKIFQRAWISANNLWNTTPVEAGQELTPDQRAEILRAQQMSDSIAAQQYLKQLNA